MQQSEPLHKHAPQLDPYDRCIHDLFEEQSQRTPHSIAVMCDGQRLTYEELNSRANRFGRYLRTLGVRTEVVVGICMERSLELMVAILGTIKAGGAYLPLDPLYPLERLRFMVADAGAKIVLAPAERKDIGVGAVTMLDIREHAHVIEHCSAESLECDVCAENLIYVMYTSGSSGQPKGVAIPHRGVVRLVKNTDYVDIRSSDVFLQYAPFTFDASTFEIWAPLLNGAKLVLYTGSPIDIPRLRATVESNGVSILWLTAGLFHRIVDGALSVIAPIKQLLSGGDALSAAHVRRVLESYPDCCVINGYGPTEGTTFSTCFRITTPKIVGHTVPIGIAINGTNAYVLDEYLREMSQGQPGELYISGLGLARGYVNSPRLTAERFVPDPYGSPGSRMYRTGDIVRKSASGCLEFIYRADRQLKVRGFRIEPAEIEAALASHPMIREAAVTAFNEVLGDKKLVAYLVGQQGESPNPVDLIAHIRKTLPDHMIPSEFVVLEQLPLSANGKIDRGALPQPK